MRPTAALLVAGLLLQGCTLLPAIGGVAAGAGAGSVSANPAVGIAVGIAVRSGLQVVANYIDRKRQAGEQDAIAETAGAAPIGQARPGRSATPSRMATSTASSNPSANSPPR